MTRKSRSAPSDEKPAHRVGLDCLATAARVVDRAVTGAYEESLRPFDLKAPQFTLLMVLHRVPNLTAAQMAEFLVIDRSTLSRNLARLVERGLIREQPVEDDARAFRLDLTPQGTRLLNRALPAWQEAQQRVTTLLGEDESHRLLSVAWGLMGRPAGVFQAADPANGSPATSETT